MAGLDNILLFSFGSLLRADILAWVVGIPVVLGFVALLLWQMRQQKELETDLEQLAKLKRHNIEYELVLKAMKLSTWRVDVPTASVTFETDYRDRTDNISPPPGTSVLDICDQLAPAYVEKIKRGMADLMAGRIDEYHEQYEAKIPHSDKTYWAESYAAIDKRDVDGTPLTIVGATMRIDGQKEMEQALIEARNHAEESDRLKSAFLANITHEVRTPLNAIVGFSDILPMAQSEDERNQLIALIKQNNAHLLRLFDDMMNISKLEAGGNESINKTDIPLQPLLREVADKYLSACSEKGLEIQVEASDGDIIHTDYDRLKEILNQYVNNAVKFTATGSVTLRYQLQEDAIRLMVTDTGKGIPADKCNEQLFERFVKVDEFIAGTGLGLSICLRLANSLGGQVGVESVFGEGSTFWVELPR